jgi:hypothetical protein
MMTPQSGEDPWLTSWKATRPLPTPAVARVERLLENERRHDRRLRLARGVLVASALAGIALALSHAPTPGDLLHGSVLGMMILAAARLHSVRRRPEPDPGESTRSYVELALRTRESQLRIVRLGWVLALLELGFLVPWWISGYRVHGELGSTLALATAWAPLALFVLFLYFNLRLRGRLLVELRELGQARPDVPFAP